MTKSCNEDLVDVDGIFYESLITEMVAPTHHSNSMLLEMGFLFNANWNFDEDMQNISWKLWKNVKGAIFMDTCWLHSNSNIRQNIVAGKWCTLKFKRIKPLLARMHWQALHTRSFGCGLYCIYNIALIIEMVDAAATTVTNLALHFMSGESCCCEIKMWG